MHLPSLFVVIVYLSGYLFLLFAAICLACGLYYLVELAEEYTTFTKKLIRLTILSHLILHLLLIVYERFPVLQCGVGLVAHLVYLQLLRSFPFIEPSSPPFITSVILFAADNYVWFRFFKGDIELFYHYRVAPAPAMAAFFLLVVWLVPCAFFCSLTVNDAVLPASASGLGQRHMSQANMSGQSKKRRRNVVMLALDSIVHAARRTLGQHARSSSDLFSADTSFR